jgi:glycosyltransferase involved in cell wall biosynthesis
VQFKSLSVSIETSSIFSPAPAGIGQPKETRVAVLFRRFGPYHHARLNAAGKLKQVFAVEACGMEDTYAWDKVEGSGSFTRITLTDHYADSHQWKRQLDREMRRALDKIKPDVVVVPGWSSADALSALFWCAENRTPAVMMSERTEWDEPRSGWKEWVKRRLVGICSAGLVGGQAHADYLVQLGLARDQIFQGYDSVDNDYFAAKSAEVRGREADLRKRLGLPEKYFLASARFVEKKNLCRLIEAYARYRQHAQENALSAVKSVGALSAVSASPRESAISPKCWDLVLLGDGALRETINSQLALLNLRDHVLLPGFKQYEELPSYYGLASAFVHASTTEQWGLVVNEAMASGLPVLVSNRCGCAQDLVREGVNGFTFDPYNVEPLAEMMLKVSDFRFPLSDFGDASRRIIAEWGPERFANGLDAAVNTALANRPKNTGLLDRLLLRVMTFK